MIAKAADVASVVATFRYYAGWADKIQGKTIEVVAVNEVLLALAEFFGRRLIKNWHIHGTSLTV